MKCFLRNEIKFAGDSLFCEYAYVVDFDKNTFEIYRGFNKEPLPESERFYSRKPVNEEYYPVKFVHSFNINELPTEKEFLEILDTDVEGED